MEKTLDEFGICGGVDDAADALAIAICHARSATSLLSRVGGNDVKQTI